MSGTVTVTLRLAPVATVVVAFCATSVTEKAPEIARPTGPVLPWAAVAVAEIAQTVGLSWVTTRLFMPVSVKSAVVTEVQSRGSLPVSLNCTDGPVWLAEVEVNVRVGPWLSTAIDAVFTKSATARPVPPYSTM